MANALSAPLRDPRRACRPLRAAAAQRRRGGPVPPCWRPSPTRPTGSPTRSAAAWRGGRGRPPAARPAAQRRGALPARGRSSTCVAARCARAGCRSRWSGSAGCCHAGGGRPGRARCRCAHDPTAGAALVRLLTGARAGGSAPRDLAALGRRAADAGRAGAGRAPRATAATGGAVPDAPSLVEALDDLGAAGAGYSADGYRRSRARLRLPSCARCAAARPSRCPTWSPTSSARCSLDVEVAAAPDRAARPGRRAPGRVRGRRGRLRGRRRGARRWARSWPTWPRPRTRSAAWTPGGSTSTPTGCRCSPCTRPRAWSGTSSPCRADRRTCSRDRCRPAARAGRAARPRCRTRCAATAPTCPCSTWSRRGTRRASTTRGRTSCEAARSAPSPRSAGSRTWPRPGPGTCCSPPATGGTPRSGRAARRRSSPSCRRPGRAGRPVADAPADGATNPLPPPAPVPWPADPLGARRPLVEQGAALVRGAGEPVADEGTLFAEETCSPSAGSGRRRSCWPSGPRPRRRAAPTCRCPATSR